MTALCECGHKLNQHRLAEGCKVRNCDCVDYEEVPAERLTKPGEIWVCVACGRAREGDRYNMGDTSCVLWATLCKAEKGCECVEPCPGSHWIALPSPKHASA